MLELIAIAQQAGFSLAEIRALVPQQRNARSHDRILAELRKKLAEVEALQKTIAATRAGLKQVIERIEKTPPGGDCFENTERVLKNLRATPRRDKRVLIERRGRCARPRSGVQPCPGAHNPPFIS